MLWINYCLLCVFQCKLLLRCLQDCFLQMRDIHQVRHHRTHKVALLAVNELVSDNIDYCNFLCRGLSCFNLCQLQCSQHILHTVTNHRNFGCVTTVLKILHWLPAGYHCVFKTVTVVFRFLHGMSPTYFEPFLTLRCCSTAPGVVTLTRRTHQFHFSPLTTRQLNSLVNSHPIAVNK